MKVKKNAKDDVVPPDGRSYARPENIKSPPITYGGKTIINTSEELDIHVYAIIPTCTADQDVDLSVMDHSLYQSVDSSSESYNVKSNKPDSGQTKEER